MNKHQLQYQSQTIEYEIHRKRVKNINMRVKSGFVYVSAPLQVSQQTIESILLKKGEWILHALKQLKESESRNASEMNWVEGDEVMYLGERFVLSIKVASKEHVEQIENRIEIHLRNPFLLGKRKQLYECWIRKQAQTIFLDIMEEQLEQLSSYIDGKPILKIRKMRARWGTCFSTKNTIQLNLELIKKPKEAIEYVVLHELAHFIHPNHSKNFYDFIATIMPDWEQRKKLLKH